MSYRKAKLLMEAKKNQQQKEETTNVQEEQEQEKPTAVLKKQNVFEAFGNDSSSEEQKEAKKQVKVQKKQVKQTKNEPKKKSKKQKQKQKQQKKGATKEEQLNEQQIEKYFGKLQVNESKKQQEEQQSQWRSLLNINQTKFNYEKELKRHFGNTGIRQQKQDDPEMGKRQQKMMKKMKQMIKKSILLPTMKNPFFLQQKFDIQRQEKTIRFVPTKKYQHLQVEFESIRNSNNINHLFQFMQMHPEHVDSVYAVGEFMRLQGNYRDADDLIQRVIYIYELAASYDFGEFLKDDIVHKKVVYQTYSVSLFMSLFKFIDILAKKGCYRAGLEFNKFLLKINTDDPTGCLLCLDFNSISSKSSDYLLNFVSEYSNYLQQQKCSVYLLPNFTFSTALAKYYVETTQKTTKQENQLLVESNKNQHLLRFTDLDWNKAMQIPQKSNSLKKQSARVLILRAILLYPRLVLEIAKKNQYEKQFLNFPQFKGNQKKPFKQILAHQFWQNSPTSYPYIFLRIEQLQDSTGLDKILEVYIEKSKILWKSSEVMLWVKAAMGFVLDKIDNKQFQYLPFLQNLCTSDVGIPIPFLLRRYSNISRANFTDRVDRIDLANIQDNQQRPQQQPQNQNRMNLQGNPLAMFFNSLLPWVNLPNAQHDDPDMPDIEEDQD